MQVQTLWLSDSRFLEVEPQVYWYIFSLAALVQLLQLCFPSFPSPLWKMNTQAVNLLPTGIPRLLFYVLVHAPHALPTCKYAGLKGCVSCLYNSPWGTWAGFICIHSWSGIHCLFGIAAMPSQWTVEKCCW